MRRLRARRKPIAPCVTRSRLTALASRRKPEIVALNKIDAMTPAEANRKRSALSRAIGKDVRLVSGVSGAGVRELVNEIAAMLRERRTEEVQAVESKQDWTP
jgi:GTP-binding protein